MFRIKVDTTRNILILTMNAIEGVKNEFIKKKRTMLVNIASNRFYLRN